MPHSPPTPAIERVHIVGVHGLGAVSNKLIMQYMRGMRVNICPLSRLCHCKFIGWRSAACYLVQLVFSNLCTSRRHCCVASCQSHSTTFRYNDIHHWHQDHITDERCARSKERCHAKVMAGRRVRLSEYKLYTPLHFTLCRLQFT